MAVNNQQVFLARIAEVRRAWENRPMTKEMEERVRMVVKDEAKRIVDENVRLKLLINSLLSDLPTNRDWLDPDLEREMREAIRSTAALEDVAAGSPLPSQLDAIKAAVAERNKGYRDRRNGDLLNKACADKVAAIVGLSDWGTEPQEAA